jgi:hypothetical protein
MHFLIISFFVHSADVAEEEKKPAAAPRTVSDNQSGHPPATLEPCVTNTAEGSQDVLQNDNVEDQGISQSNLLLLPTSLLMPPHVRQFELNLNHDRLILVPFE